MKMIRLTKDFNFEMAHALYGYDGPCRNVHGHSYQLSVTIRGAVRNEEGSASGMVMDFADLKKIVLPIVEQLDHATVLNGKTAHRTMAEENPLFGKLILTDYQPTCENLLIDIAARILRKLPAGMELHHLKLRETPSSFAEWHAEDNLNMSS